MTRRRASVTSGNGSRRRPDGFAPALRTSALAFASLAVVMFMLSCFPTPKLGPKPQVGPALPPPGEPVALRVDAAPDTAAQVAAADSAAAELNRIMLERGQTGPSPDMVTPLPQPAPRPPSRGSSGTAATPASTSPALADTARAAPAGPDSAPRADAPSVSVQLSPQEQAKLESTARTDIAAADSLVRSAALRQLQRRERDKLETALGLTRQAEEAIVRGDLQAAANLAYKAKLLASEVALKTR